MGRRARWPLYGMALMLVLAGGLAAGPWFSTGAARAASAAGDPITTISGNLRVLMTSATPAMVYYAPKNRARVLRQVAGWVRHAHPVTQTLPRSVRVDTMDYVGPAILYLGSGADRVTLYPAYVVVPTPEGDRIQYLAGLVVYRRTGREWLLQAPALDRWMRAGRWKPLFQTATARELGL